MLQAIGLTKRYGGVAALQNVNLEVRPAEVIGLIGENGAGKSTLIKTLCGLVQPDAGQMLWDSKPATGLNPKASEKLGLGVIHQERHVLDNLTVAENLFLGREPKKGFLVDNAKLIHDAQKALDWMGLDIKANALGSTLSNAQKQLIEIARALTLEARLIIMDEPTSSLSAGETEKLLGVVLELKNKGVAIIYVSHRLNEIKQIADRVVGLRDGQNAGELTKEEISTDSMVRLMVGRNLLKIPKAPSNPGVARLVVKDLRTRRYPDASVSFTVHAGEVVGFAGLVGSGRTEIVRALFGVDRPLSGEITIDGKPVKAGQPSSAIQQGILLAPEDRRNQGVLLDLSVEKNINLPSVPRLGSSPLVDEKSSRQRAESQKTSLAVKCATIDAPVSSMSGGNQQKVVLAKWLAMKSSCLILDEPTCGIDVGARAEIYDIMKKLADQGTALLMVSSDMEEVMAQSDRILVFSQGHLAGELSREEATEEAIMKLAVGHA
jgi:ribose transport system ATP-binding protein